MSDEFLNKVALVTGAGSGIGRASALLFARHGAKVAVVDIDTQQGEETARQITALGGECAFIAADVASLDAVRSMVERTVTLFGGLDYAHNNAGIEGAQVATADCSEENWDRALAVNLKSIWLCMKFQIPEMLKRGGGAIVNTASVAGLRGLRHAPAYTASKHGVIGLTKAAALDYADMNIRINAVCPGFTRTAMVDRLSATQPEAIATAAAAVPIGRIGEPQEIAAAVLWLCSTAAGFMTGHAMSIDGGETAR